MASTSRLSKYPHSPTSTIQNNFHSISPTLWYRIHVFLFDLQHYNQREDSKSRLEKITDPRYIGFPYFEPQEADAIRSLDCNGLSLSQILEEKLDERLNRRIDKRVESGDFRVCAAHDLAPVLGDALGIDLKRLSKEKVFLDLLDSNGLDLGETQWDGQPKKSYSPKNSKKRGR